MRTVHLRMASISAGPHRAQWHAGTGTPTSGRHRPPEAGGTRVPLLEQMT